ncbi:hypothetical protein ElyMa_004912500 [Elysia marginata]|uniref:Uncharacterized protein n=1 Tax=Elysia marginata TaxID=1093978 RepID=A0AAV4J1N7_9GAST|nr:hypothetical protein ElyMa_004912500 [Elysia marginata]
MPLMPQQTSTFDGHFQPICRVLQAHITTSRIFCSWVPIVQRDNNRMDNDDDDDDDVDDDDDDDDDGDGGADGKYEINWVAFRTMVK